MSNTIRIRTTPNGDDKYVKVNLEQDFDFIEILSLKISQEDAYAKFCSDYGVIVGRVTVNNGFGVPNAKVSVFIPLDDIDKENPEIKNLYPYEVVTDRDSNGVRYNLLSKDGSANNECLTSVGTFPSKREILDNPVLNGIYCKYYKFTTTTNHAGDFMLFGVPVGTHIVHIDADISDIGIISQRPYDLINQGIPTKSFDSTSKFKTNKNLDKLLQIKTIDTGVNVEPFWGDLENCQVGITRLDIPLNHTVIPTAIFIGSIFGDDGKNSVNKHCKPRVALGRICEQITGEGSVEMIRKSYDGYIEQFDVNGGRVIDENGSWAYQIPMNLDYMITDEFGKLIFTQDPNFGIATRSSVRFRINMDETGGEARLRTRANFLVPNNPKTKAEIDYNFGDASSQAAATKNTSFKDIYWNKIYSISSHIPRHQKGSEMLKVFTALSPVTAAVVGGVANVPPSMSDNNFIGVKDVDNCPGDKTPFPYNKVNTTINPIFTILCLIMSILSIIIIIINAFMITVVNMMLFVVKAIIKFINKIVDIISSLFNINSLGLPEPDYAPCIHVKCPTSEPNVYYVPGCIKGAGSPLSEGYKAAEKNGMVDNDVKTMLKCLAFQMAQGMNMYKYDFYNDWVNGTLFSFLLKYKKKRSRANKPGAEKFCEFDCNEFSGDVNYTGVDSNKNGIKDNFCHTQYLLDSCFTNGIAFTPDYQNYGQYTNPIRSGLIKKVNGELYYVATTHDCKYKLFATDIICLGSVFESDWQGIPKISQYLTPTSYNMTNDVTDYDENGVVIATGIADINDGNGGLFFDVDCGGIHVPEKGCLNLRKACEYGVTLDQIEYGPAGAVTPPDAILGSNDIDDDSGNWFRDVFYLLNNSPKSASSFTLPSVINTSFNIHNKGSYNFLLPSENGVAYQSFRGFSTSGTNPFSQTEHSYYFYFGVIPGKTSIDKMNTTFFNKCDTVTKDSMIIDSSSTPTTKTGKVGAIIFKIIGGKGPISYTIIGLNYSSVGTTSPDTNNTISGLGLGLYTIEATDSLGNVTKKEIYISGPAPLIANAYVSKNALTVASNDGEITISNISNGTQPYGYVLKNSAGAILKAGVATTPLVLTGLAYQDPIGYTIEIGDSTGEKVVISNLIVSGMPILTASASKTDTTCFNEGNGTITVGIVGGKLPYTIVTTGPNSFSSTNMNLIDLKNGTYTTTVTDSLSTPQTITLTTNIASVHPEMVLTAAPASVLNMQCNTSFYRVSVLLSYSFSTPIKANLQFSNINGKWIDINNLWYTDASTPLSFNVHNSDIGTNIKIRVEFGKTGCFSNILDIPTSDMVRPITALNGNINTDFIPTGPPFFKHSIVLWGGIGAINGTPYGAGDVYDDNFSIITTISDSVGCTVTING